MVTLKKNPLTSAQFIDWVRKSIGDGAARSLEEMDASMLQAFRDSRGRYDVALDAASPRKQFGQLAGRLNEFRGRYESGVAAST